MPLPIGRTRESTPAPPKRQRSEAFVDEEDGRSSSDYDSEEDINEEDRRAFYEEWDKSEGFELDFTKFPNYVTHARAVDLEGTDIVCSEPDTNRAFLSRLSKVALKTYNEAEKKNLAFVKVMRANSHTHGITIYITFQVFDPSDRTVKLYQALVMHLPRNVQVCFCRPRPNYTIQFDPTR